MPARYWDGDHYKADFTLDSDFQQYGFPANGGIELKLTPPSQPGRAGNGAKVTSTFYLQFGRFAAQVRTGCGAGVVTSLITYADDKDEIDCEWTGGPPRAGAEGTLADLQTNVFSKGVIDPSDMNVRNVPVGSNTCESTHVYEVLWTPEKIDWLIDGRLVNTYRANQNCNTRFTESPRNCRYPVSPSRISFAIWDGGAPDQSPGVNEWAGGRTQWGANTEYKATFDWVEVQCWQEMNNRRPTGVPPRQGGYNAPSRTEAPLGFVMPGAKSEITLGGKPLPSDAVVVDGQGPGSQGVIIYRTSQRPGAVPGKDDKKSGAEESVVGPMVLSWMMGGLVASMSLLFGSISLM
ncbi:hypothetical protein HK102_000995 [Quaeritorhiza haematococci]|nr:hypothetical protein HK102_000995 [Quaeritorhiza haematococci]